MKRWSSCENEWLDVVAEPEEDAYEHENKLYAAYLEAEAEEASMMAKVERDKDFGKDLVESYERQSGSEKYYQKFHERIRRNPSQCLRYDYGGQPLFSCPKSKHWMPPKCACGAERVFEAQVCTYVSKTRRNDSRW